MTQNPESVGLSSSIHVNSAPCSHCFKLRILQKCKYVLEINTSTGRILSLGWNLQVPPPPFGTLTDTSNSVARVAAEDERMSRVGDGVGRRLPSPATVWSPPSSRRKTRTRTKDVRGLGRKGGEKKSGGGGGRCVGGWGEGGGGTH